MGHGDTLVIGDAGLPIPPGTERIDLAVSAGIPAFLDVLAAVLGEMQVEQAHIADELAVHSPAMHTALRAAMQDIAIETVSHEALKTMTRSARAVVRTGEFTPYANVVLASGVVF
jgi:D-ribose pyranase